MQYTNKRYILKSKKYCKNNTVAKLRAMLDDIEKRLISMQTAAKINGDENWKNSRLAVLLISARKVIRSIFMLRAKRVRTPDEKVYKDMQMKSLFHQLNIYIGLIKDELQARNEIVKAPVVKKQNSIIPELLRQMQLQHTI